MGGAQSVHDKIREQDERIAEWERTSTSTTTQAPPLVFHDEADLSVSNKINHESADVHLDQSNHGFSFINLHWASFSTGLSSVLAVLISLGLIAGYCYARGHRQCQSRARHTKVLRTIVHGAIKTISTNQQQQSGAYPGPSSSFQSSAVQRLPTFPTVADDRLIFEPPINPA